MTNVLLQKNRVSTERTVSAKMLVSAGMIALAVLLPQLVHATLGAKGGAQWLPMYLPIIIGGCLLGFKWGLCIGVLSPIASFALTAVFGEPMPAAARLPYIMVELAVFAAVSGAFSKKIAADRFAAFPAVLVAAVSGRIVFLTLAALFQSVSPLSFSAAWAQVQAGLVGLVVQIALAPVAVIGILALIKRYDK